MSQVEAPSESRFAHLLQPIRDLAANWDIDIANELEDYLVRSCLQGPRCCGSVTA